MTRNTSQDPEYEGLPYHEKKFHKTHFGVIKELGGNKRVKVKTKDGFTYVSEAFAIENELEIVKKEKENA